MSGIPSTEGASQPHAIMQNSADVARGLARIRGPSGSSEGGTPRLSNGSGATPPTGSSGGKRTRQKRSFVWNYFCESETDPNQALCYVCSQTIPRGRNCARNTTNLRKHLEHRHPEVFSAAGGGKSSPPPKSTSQSQPQPAASSSLPMPLPLPLPVPSLPMTISHPQSQQSQQLQQQPGPPANSAILNPIPIPNSLPSQNNVQQVMPHGSQAHLQTMHNNVLSGVSGVQATSFQLNQPAPIGGVGGLHLPPQNVNPIRSRTLAAQQQHPPVTHHPSMHLYDSPGSSLTYSNAQYTTSSPTLNSVPPHLIAPPEDEAAIRAKLAELLVSENLPLSFANCQGMRRFLTALNVRTTIPSPDILSSHIIPELHRTVQTRVTHAIAELQTFAVSVCPTESHHLVILSYVNSAGKYISCCLSALPSPLLSADTARLHERREEAMSNMEGGGLKQPAIPEWQRLQGHLLTTTRKILQNWGMYNKCHAIVMRTDEDFDGEGAKALASKLQNSAVEFLPCLARGVERIYEKVIFQDRWYSSLLANVREAVTYALQNPVPYAMARKTEDMTRLDEESCELVLDNPDEPDIESTVKMLERFIKNYATISRVLNSRNAEEESAESNAKEKGGVKIEATLATEKRKENENNSSRPTKLTDKEVVETVQNVLRMFLEARRIFSLPGSQGSIATAIPVIKGLCKIIMRSDGQSSEMNALFRTVQTKLGHQFSEMESRDTYAIATLLDPRFKSRVFENNNSAERAQRALVSACEKLDPSYAYRRSPVIDEHGVKVRRLDPSSMDEPSAKRQKSGILGQFLHEISDHSFHGSPDHESISSYLSEPVAVFEKSVEEYWQENRERFPLLARIAGKYLAVPSRAAMISEKSVEYPGVDAGDIQYLRYNLRSGIMET